MGMVIMFRSAKQSRIFQDIVDQIQETILSGKLKPGDVLPPERELKEVLKVSRGTLREALRVLEQKGLLEMRLGVGGGAVVKEASYEKVGESLDILIRSKKVPLNHLAEFRENVEGDIAALAAQRADEKEIKLLNELYQAAEEIVHEGKNRVKAFIDVDKSFHKALAKISKNPVYESIQHTVHSNIDQYYETFLTMEKREFKENLSDLKALLEAIEKKDSEKARQLARQHVCRFNHYMEECG